MKLHKFTCTECDGKPFYTSFAPVYDEGPAFCPCCGKDYMATYHGEVNLEEANKREQRVSEVA